MVIFSINGCVSMLNEDVTASDSVYTVSDETGLGALIQIGQSDASAACICFKSTCDACAKHVVTAAAPLK